MLIIVEGVDGAGKTTFCNRLAELIQAEHPRDSVEIWHKGPPTAKDALEEYELPLQRYRPWSKRHIICDRWHIGELVYGPLLRGSSMLDVPRLRHLEMFLQSRGAIQVHVNPPIEDVRARLAERGGDELIDDEHLPKIMQAYRSEMIRTSVRTVTTYWPERRVYQRRWLDITMKAAHDAEVDAMWTRSFTTYVGSVRRKGVILCGERRNQNRDNRWTSAFVPLSNSSGHFLLEHLQMDMLPTIGLANACEEDLRSLATITGASFVALGSQASRALDAAKIPHGSVPHPQYIRRFHHSAGFAYGQAIFHAAALNERSLSWRP